MVDFKKHLNASKLWRLRNEYSACKSCDLCKYRKQIVFGEVKTAQPTYMLIGEAPGEEEDLQGIPFCGKSGVVLRKLCVAAGIDLEDSYITNSVLCRPKDNAKPKKSEVLACRDRLIKQISIVNPRAIIFLGHTAANIFFDIRSMEERGMLTKPMIKTILQAVPSLSNLSEGLITYHPSWVLRQTTLGSKRKAVKTVVANLRRLREVLTGE